MDNFDRFPTGKDRKHIIKISEEVKEDFINDDNKEFRYNWVDSPADNDNFQLNTYEPKGRPFMETFKEVIGQEYLLTDYIEKELSSKKGEAIGVEFGGVGVGFFNSFSKDFFKKSFGVTLVDHRMEHRRMSSSLVEQNINHKILLADIFDEKFYEKLEKDLEGKKVDLIVSRMGAGLEFVPGDPYLVGKTLNMWYKLLAEDGLMLVQTPIIFNKILFKWSDKVLEESKGLIDFKFTRGDTNGSVSSSAFNLKKLKGAPEDLPMLDPKTIFKSERF
ncbi:MAG: hypothetical protein AAB895_03165 [Patescibacteria group bacterium]